MSRKENLLKFWEGIENNKKGLQISPRSSNTRPQKLIIEKNFQNCLSVVNNTDNIRVKLHQNIGDVSPALEVPSQCPDSLPLLPRQDILPQPTKNRARREARARSSNRERPRNTATSSRRSDSGGCLELNLTPPAAETEFIDEQKYQNGHQDHEKDQRTTRNHNTVNHNQGSEDAVGKKSVGRNEFLHYDDARRRLEEEIKKKVTGSGKPTGPSVTGKCPPSTFPKPGVSPRRSSLQFTQSQSLKESQLSPRRSVGDVFGCRVGGSNPDLERNQKNSGPTTVSSKTYGAPGDFKAELTRKLSNEKNASGHVENARIDESFNRSGSNHALVGRSVGRQENQLKHSASPDHPSLIRSATWLEEFKHRRSSDGSLASNQFRADGGRMTDVWSRGGQERSSKEITELRNEFEARISKLESELCMERQRREGLEKELFEIKILLQQQRKL